MAQQPPQQRQLTSSLIDVDDSILIVIDVQDYFVRKLPEGKQKPLVDRIVWLIHVANQLKVPIVVTAEDIPSVGNVTAEVAKALLPKTTTIHNKMTFGLAEETQIMADIEKSAAAEGGRNRNTVIFVGLETDVCVTHSALGLQQCGYQVAVVEDATASPSTGHEFGLQRLRDAGGIVISSVKGLYYEWVRTVARDHEIRNQMDALQLHPPNDLTL